MYGSAELRKVFENLQIVVGKQQPALSLWPLAFCKTRNPYPLIHGVKWGEGCDKPGVKWGDMGCEWGGMGWNARRGRGRLKDCRQRVARIAGIARDRKGKTLPLIGSDATDRKCGFQFPIFGTFGDFGNLILG
jgi:hypothetical protein